MSRSKNADKLINAPWEATHNSDRILSLSHSLLASEAWKDLSPRQRLLYIELKRRYWRKVDKGVIVAENQDKIHFVKQERDEFYGYDDNGQFKNDRQALIDHGFIRIVFSGGNVRKPNLYGFTKDWRDWKPPGAKETKKNGKKKPG